MAQLLASLLLLGGPGCVIPPPIEVDTSDAGVTNRPVWINRDYTSPSLIQPGLTVLQSKPGGPPVTQEFIVAFDDEDRGQTISVRLFLDRNYKSFLREEKGFNVVRFGISGLCDSYVNNTPGRYDLEVYVTDSGFPDQDANDLRKFNPGGYRDNGLWDLLCAPSSGL